MKKIFFVLVSVILGLLAGHSQSGTWSGDLDVQGVKLPLVFHLDAENPTLDSPAQGAKGIPVQVTHISPDSISINIPLIGVAFTGKVHDNQIVGKFTQRGVELPLTLTSGERTIHRPQTPQPPYPYMQEEVCFSNGDAVLIGTLTLPEGYSRQTPVVIMITGSGLQNRDEELFEHKPFAVLADALARNGIASLRYDDRGCGESTGDAVNCTTADLRDDALAGLNMLRQRFDLVGALGHSEGGSIALMLGADKRVDFIISLAAMVISGKETLMDQNRYALTQAGYPQQVIDNYCTLLSKAFDGEENLDYSGLPEELKQNIQPALGQLKMPYLQYFMTLDLRDRLVEITCPVLALNGTKDTQVFPKKNLQALTALPENPANKVMALDGLNHLFQHCQTGSTAEYATIEETISPEVLTIIAQWLNEVAQMGQQVN